MKVIDNIISKKDQNFIKNNLLDNANFPWSFISDVSKKDNIHQRRPGFKHIFKNYNLIEPILVNTRAKLNKVLYAKDEILEARSFLQLPLDKNLCIDSDRGKPVNIGNKNSSTSELFKKIAIDINNMVSS